MAVHVRYNHCYVFLRPTFVLCGEREPQRIFFNIYFSNFTLCSISSFEKQSKWLKSSARLVGRRVHQLSSRDRTFGLVIYFVEYILVKRYSILYSLHRPLRLTSILYFNAQDSASIKHLFRYVLTLSPQTDLTSFEHWSAVGHLHCAVPDPSSAMEHLP